MNKLPHVAGLLFNKPLLITPDYAETLSVVLSERMGFSAEGMSIKSEAKEKRNTQLAGRGTFVLPAVGSMTHRATGMDAMSGMTSYNQLQAQLAEAFDNPDVKSIMLDFDSPGGMVSGCFDLRDFLMEHRGKKPVYALAQDSMYSAAYLLGSTADKVFTTQTGGVGSIGVVAMHVDQSKKNEMAGVKPTFIYAGDYKVAGNPHEKLEGEALAYMQESVNESYEMFINAVASARNMDAQAVRDTQARTYRGGKAVKVGLSDGIANTEQVLKLLGENTPKTYGVSAITNKGKMMDTNQIDEMAGLVATLQAANEKLTTDNETLRKQVLDAGFAITKEGLVKNAEPEMLEVEGVLVDKATLPAVVVKALEAKAADELKAAATAQFPNLREEVATKLYGAFKNDAEVMNAVASLNTAVGGLMEEAGDKTPAVEMSTSKDKLNKLVAQTMEEKGVNQFTAFAMVAKTADGAKLIQETYKEE